MGDAGFIYAIICTVAQSMATIVIGACMERLLTGRDEKISKRKRIVIWSTFSCIISGIKCLSSLTAIYISVGNPIVMNLFLILFLKYCYRDKVRTKLLHLAMLLLQGVLADVIHEVVWGRPYLEMQYIPFRTRSTAEACIIVAALAIMMNIIYTMIVLRMRKKKQGKISPAWLAFMLLFILVFTAMRVMRDEQVSGEAMSSYFIFICVSAILEFSIVMLCLSQWEKRETQEEIGKLQQVMELEKVHYEQIEARREEMAKIRHDYNNVITSVLFLIENGRTDEAGNVIKDLSERMSKTREYPFCGVPIINAILTEKQKECEAEDISLNVNLLIPDTIAVADLDLCMIFGNLMDNAIRSCKELLELEKECSIILTGGIVQEYLIVKCRNTSLENREKKIKGTGYGHKILTDIAGKYDGDFQTEYENGIFTAQISLKL